MVSETSRICWTWCIWSARIWGFRFPTENLKPLYQHKHWECGYYLPTIIPEEPHNPYFRQKIFLNKKFSLFRQCFAILVKYITNLMSQVSWSCRLYPSSEHIVNDITNFCFRFLPKPYTEAFAGPKTKFLMSLTIVITSEKSQYFRIPINVAKSLAMHSETWSVVSTSFLYLM